MGKINNWLTENSTDVLKILIGSFATAFFAILIGYFGWVGVTVSKAVAEETYNKDRRVSESRLDRIIDKIDKGFSGVSDRFAGIDEKLAGMEEKFNGMNEMLKEYKKSCDVRTKLTIKLPNDTYPTNVLGTTILVSKPDLNSLLGADGSNGNLA